MKRRFRDRLIERLQQLGIIFPVLLSVGYLELSLGFLPSLPYPILIALLLCCIAFAFLKGQMRVDRLGLAFLVAIPLTIVLAEPRAVFRSWERFAAFSIVFSFASVLLRNPTIKQYRKIAFFVCLLIAATIGSLSFFAYYLGINYMSEDINVLEEYVENAGRFGGLTKHSMMLGPLSGLGMVAMVHLFLQKRKWYYLIPAVLCSFSVLFSASRSAFLSMLIGFAVLVFLHSNGWNRFLKRISLVLLLLVATYSWWNSAADPLKEKYQRHVGDTELFDSRSTKVVCRMKEFQSSPIWGVGFSAIDPKFKDDYSDSGTIEPGSSWLGVLSMTGLIGMCFVLTMFYRAFRGLWRNREGNNKVVLACFMLMSSHMFVEGYIFASGNPLSFIFWLMIGLGCDAYIEERMLRRTSNRYGRRRYSPYRQNLISQR